MRILLMVPYVLLMSVFSGCASRDYVKPPLPHLPDPIPYSIPEVASEEGRVVILLGARKAEGGVYLDCAVLGPKADLFASDLAYFISTKPTLVQMWDERGVPVRLRRIVWSRGSIHFRTKQVREDAAFFIAALRTDEELESGQYFFSFSQSWLEGRLALLMTECALPAGFERQVVTIE